MGYRRKTARRVPYKKRRYASKYKKKGRPRRVASYGAVAKYKRIPRGIKDRMSDQVALNLCTDFQIYLDPKLTTDASPLQKSFTIQFAVNSVYPFLIGAGQDFLIKDPNTVCNFETTPTPFDRDNQVFPSTASVAASLFNQGDYAVGRKYEQAIITGAHLAVWATNTSGFPTGQPIAQQAGLLTLAKHNNRVNPFGVNTENKDLKLIASRITKRIEPTLLGGNLNVGMTRNTTLGMGVGIARENGITNIMDNRDEFAFSLGAATDLGVSARIPNELNYISLNYTPAMTAQMTGAPQQAVPVILRVRLKQRLICYEKRSHSVQPGVNWNLAKPINLKPFIYGGTMGAIMGAAGGY